jgi:roadblock/LC7 domain-containing protein
MTVGRCAVDFLDAPRRVSTGSTVISCVGGNFGVFVNSGKNKIEKKDNYSRKICIFADGKMG